MRRSTALSTLAKVRFARDLILAKARGRKVPLLVYWFLTNRCNYRCSYCYGLFYQDPAPDVPTEVMLRMADEMARGGVRRVNLLGGEPMMRPDVGLIIDRLVAHRVSVCILTNGAFLPARLSEIRNVSEVGMSIDGREDVHDSIRGRGAFAALTKAIEACRREGITVVLTYTMVSENIADLDFVLDFARKQGVLVTINAAHGRIFGARDVPVSRLTTEECRRALDRILALQSGGFPVFRARRTLQLMRRWTDFSVDTSDTAPSRDFPSCRFGEYGATIRSDGTLIPCFLNRYDDAGLRVQEHGFEKAWAHCQGMRHCRYCHVPCFIEYNSIFSLSLPVLWNAAMKLCVRPLLPRRG